MITSKSKTALSVCLAVSVSLLTFCQQADAKSKSSGYRSANRQIAALPFFKKDSDKGADAKKKPADKSPDADEKADKSKTEKVSPPAVTKGEKKKGKETAESKDAATAKKADKPATEAKSEAPAKVETAAEKSEGKAEAAEEKAPAFAPDASLISVLKDLSKALKDPEQVQKLTEDANQQAVMAQAQTILSRALDNSELTFNRIISADEERQFAKTLSPESWASGEINFGDGTGSLSAVWAKRVNGLLNLTVAGKCKDKTAPNGKKIGNFVVVITGRSPIEAGFDIQTQSNVNFWLGQLASATIDSDCLSEASAESNSAAEENVKKKSLAALPILVTDRVVAYKRELTAYEARKNQLLAQKAEEEKRASDERAQLTAQAIAEATAKVLKESTNRSLTKDETLKGDADDSDDASDLSKDDESKSGGGKPANTKTSIDKASNVKAGDAKAADAKTGSGRSADDKSADAGPGETKPGSAKAGDERPSIAKTESAVKEYVEKGAINPVSAGRTKPEAPDIDSRAWSSPADKIAISSTGSSSGSNRSNTNRLPGQSSTLPSSNQSVWESPAGSPQSRQASLAATIVVPDKAIAGQFLTTSIIDKDKNGEPTVELSFNGAALATDSRGQALYMVPEDATPGRSLNVCLASRPELANNLIDILQPLTTAYEAQAPKIERISSMVAPKSMLVIEGHNFDGHADHNRILIDGLQEARIIAASPVQLKAILPAGIRPGNHSFCVGTSGMRSNSATVDVIAAEVQQDPKELGRDNLSKLVVKVLGTSNRVNVRVTNNTPDVLKIQRGNEMLVTTPGGANNSVVVGVQRLKKGAYNVEAVIEQ